MKEVDPYLFYIERVGVLMEEEKTGYAVAFDHLMSERRILTDTIKGL